MLLAYTLKFHFIVNMNRITSYRVAGVLLAIAILLLGVASTTLLYYAGDRAIGFFSNTGFVYDQYGRMSKRMPQDDPYGSAMMRVWAVGFIYILTSISAFVASLFCKKTLVILHLFVSILTLVVGSFLHTAGGMALLVYRLIVGQGLDRSDFFFPTCVLKLPNGDLEADERCLKGREALNLLVVALVLLGISWLLTLADVIFHAITYSFVSSVRTYKRKTGPPQRGRAGGRPNSEHRRTLESQGDVTLPSHGPEGATGYGPVPSTSRTDTAPKNLAPASFVSEQAAEAVSEPAASTLSAQTAPIAVEQPTMTASGQTGPPTQEKAALTEKPFELEAEVDLDANGEMGAGDIEERQLLASSAVNKKGTNDVDARLEMASYTKETMKL